MTAVTQADLDAMRSEISNSLLGELRAMAHSTPAPVMVKPKGRPKSVAPKVIGPPPVIETVEAGGREWSVASGWTAKDGSVGHYSAAHVRPLTTTAKGKRYAARALTIADLDALATPEVHQALSAAVDRVERAAGIGGHAEDAAS